MSQQAASRPRRFDGRYLGCIRQLKPRQRAEVKAVRERKRVEEAIKKPKRIAVG